MGLEVWPGLESILDSSNLSPRWHDDYHSAGPADRSVWEMQPGVIMQYASVYLKVPLLQSATACKETEATVLSHKPWAHFEE